MSDQLPLLSDAKSILLLPSAKVKAADRVGVHAWTNFYAAFSEKFVSSSIEALGVSSRSVLLDPFVGSGTTLVSALKFGVRAIGVDLDPFSCILARSKISTNVDADEVERLLKPSRRKTPSRNFSELAINTFDQGCLAYASTVFDRLQERVCSQGGGILEILFSDVAGKFDSEAVALAALCIGAADSAKVVRGSNPTWYRKAVAGEKDSFEELYRATKTALHRMVLDIVALKSVAGRRDILILNRNIQSVTGEIKNRSVDFIITSPPYLTRLDYIVKHLPNLLILTGLVDVDMEDLRKKMIGTPKIIHKGGFQPEWGEACVRTLEAIRGHSSYASESYYIWTYYQYFRALYEMLSVLTKKVKKNCKGLFVVQDSYYKEIEIELSQILIEMLNGFGFDAMSVRKDEVRNNMRQLNPAHMKKVVGKRSSEHTVFFEGKASSE